MAYATSNPPLAARDGGGLTSFGNSQGVGGRHWVYKSPVDNYATVAAAGYISNASALGMQVGDTIEVHETAAVPYKVTMGTVTAISAAGASTLGTTNILVMS